MTAEFIAGAYTATFNAKALGQTAEGFRLSHQFFKRMVTGDLYGDTPQDAIYRGREQFVEFRLIEALAAGIADIIEPYGATRGTAYALGTVGKLDVENSGGASAALALSLVLTAVTGTSAASDPATATFTLAQIAENYPIDILYASDLREVPIRMRVYPNSSQLFGTET